MNKELEHLGEEEGTPVKNRCVLRACSGHSEVQPSEDSHRAWPSTELPLSWAGAARSVTGGGGGGILAPLTTCLSYCSCLLAALLRLLHCLLQAALRAAARLIS